MSPSSGAGGTPSGEIAVLSDTHGLLRPEVVDLVRGSDLILHAGDVGAGHVLAELRAIAPVRAVRGNVDRGGDPGRLPWTETIELWGHLIHVLHILDDLDLDPRAAGLSAVVYGHTHEPSLERRDGVLFLNPGSVGPKRLHLPVSMAFLTVTESGLEARLVEVDTGG